jgi:hypothetical protein
MMEDKFYEFFKQQAYQAIANEFGSKLEKLFLSHVIAEEEVNNNVRRFKKAMEETHNKLREEVDKYDRKMRILEDLNDIKSNVIKELVNAIKTKKSFTDLEIQEIEMAIDYV